VTVADEQVAALRAYLVGDDDEYDRLCERPDPVDFQTGFSALVTTAFVEAVNRRFGKDRLVADVVRFVAWTRAARAPAQTGSEPIRRIPPARTVPTCADAASSAPSRRRRTKPPTGSNAARAMAGPLRSIPLTTANATPLSARSTGSTATGRSRPDTTSSPSATKPPSTSPVSTSGCNQQDQQIPDMPRARIVRALGGAWYGRE
jgi:hypothetical protein